MLGSEAGRLVTTAVIAILCLSAFSGCLLFLLQTTTFDATLSIAYDQAKAAKGPLSTVAPLRVVVSEFRDGRPETDIIGYKRNLLAFNTAAIRTRNPVAVIVREAFIGEFTKNNHIVGNGDDEVTFDGEITTFWLDIEVIDRSNVDFMGSVVVTFNVLHGRNNELLQSRQYQGHYKVKGTFADVAIVDPISPRTNAQWEMIMNNALERMVAEMSTDATLVETLKSILKR